MCILLLVLIGLNVVSFIVPCACVAVCVCASDSLMNPRENSNSRGTFNSRCNTERKQRTDHIWATSMVSAVIVVWVGAMRLVGWCVGLLCPTIQSEVEIIQDDIATPQRDIQIRLYIANVAPCIGEDDLGEILLQHHPAAAAVHQAMG